MKRDKLTRPQLHQLTSNKSHCQNVSKIFDVLSHPDRLFILAQIAKKPRTVTELQELSSVSQSQISQFLMRMKLEGLVNVEKDGAFRIYSIRDERLKDLLQFIQDHYCC